MLKRRLARIRSSLLPVAAFAVSMIAFPVSHNCLADEFDLYFLGGQSNMEGFGKVDELPEDLQGRLADVYIFHSPPLPDQTAAVGDGFWSGFQPGHGTGFQLRNGSNRYSDRFGLEVSMLHALKQQNPARKIAVIKYARNGSSIAIEAAGRFGCWDPDFHSEEGLDRDVNQYDHCLATIRNAFSDCDIDNDGEIDVLHPVGIAWMQGESDATIDEATANAYAANLKRLMDLLRAALRKDDIPVVIGQISDSGNTPSGKVWEFGEQLRAQQQSFVENDSCAAIVTSTDGYEYSDPWHYDSAGYIDLGQQFAAAFERLQEKSPRRTYISE
ncbi:sialate O-acetylesterase [Stieleria sp. JC731]|uniref:sialate O-acetylesterase n=1 Tax=Pirellulaceae TaxID=2691357 RepID=UPI001E3EA9FB|nr:sialate O-acetylesterase [Stieleria sp. JC731]MCC9603595.1 sialate O-acetylesterase [Stieleria sp. JC731]